MNVLIWLLPSFCIFLFALAPPLLLLLLLLLRGFVISIPACRRLWVGKDRRDS
jgi:hypothetical protein